MMVGKSAEFTLQDLVFSEIVKHMKGAHVVSIAEVDKRLILFSVLILRQFLLIIYCTTLVPGDCTSNGKSKSWPKFQFPTFGVTAESKCIPVTYNLSKDLGKEPKLQLCCDLPTCNNCIQYGAYVHLACFHTFHMSCLPADYFCSICKEPLKEMIVRKKIHQFNEGLLKNGSVESDSDSSNSKTEDDAEIVTANELNNTRAQQYYTSVVWEQKVNSTLTAYWRH